MGGMVTGPRSRGDVISSASSPPGMSGIRRSGASPRGRASRASSKALAGSLLALSSASSTCSHVMFASGMAGSSMLIVRRTPATEMGSGDVARAAFTAMKGFTSTLLSRWQRLDDEQRLAMIEGVAGDAFRMEAIIAQLVDAARMHAGSLDLAPVPTDILEVAK